MEKYFSNTALTGLIKNLIQSISLPLIETATAHTKLVAGAQYIYNLQVIECMTSGRILDGAKYKVVDHFIPNQDYINLTHRARVQGNTYTEELHRYLGDYLRCCRDMFNVDMMQYYNCFQPVIIDNIEGASPTSKTFITHIKFNTTYTIALESLSSTLIHPILYTEHGVSPLTSQLKSAPIEKRTTFGEPFLLAVDVDDLDIYNTRKNLFLAITVPASNTSSIVILEGNYLNASTYNRFNVQDTAVLDPVFMNQLLKTQPSLLKVNTSSHVPFSPRLVQFLLHNIIDNQETITNNIQKIQSVLDPNHNIFEPGVWDDMIRYIIYKEAHDNDMDLTDVDGFIDSTIESYIDNGTLSYTIGRLVYTGVYQIGFNNELMIVKDSTQDQYDGTFEASTRIQDKKIINMVDVVTPSPIQSKIHSTTKNITTFSGQRDAIIDTHRVYDISDVTVRIGNTLYECTQGADYTFETTSGYVNKNIICLTGTYGSVIDGNTTTPAGRLWLECAGGLTSGAEIIVNYRYVQQYEFDTYRIDITYYE